VEAVISAVVIGVGLVGVSRALSAQLNALEAVQDYARARALVQDLAAELERPVQAGRPPSLEAEGVFEPPHDDYGWRLRAEPLDPATAGVPVSRVTLTVRRTGADTAPGWSVQTVWPSELVSPSWW